MKTLAIILVLASFIQATILPYDLVLVILICRSFIKVSKSNLYLAFAFGLLNAHLTLTSLGVKPLLFLITVQLAQIMSKSRLSNTPIFIIPISLVLLSLNAVLMQIFFEGQFIMSQILIESILSLPIFYFVRFWEERFIVRKDIRLKV